MERHEWNAGCLDGFCCLGLLGLRPGNIQTFVLGPFILGAGNNTRRYDAATKSLSRLSNS
jgi:hypothetical protein